MPTLSSVFQRSTQSGFTLVEMIISVTISALIIGGSSFFIFKTNSDAQTTKNRTQIHTEMTTYMDRMNYVRSNYSTGSILVDTPNGYDVILLANSGATAGVLIGVVNLALTDSTGGAKLDPVSGSGTYGNKALGVQELTSTQVSSLVSTPTNAYNVVFQSNRYYPALQAQRFSVTTYNSGSLFEINAGIYERFLETLAGKPVSAAENETVLPFNLVF